jgi:AcrR family transcriptional regulator
MSEQQDQALEPDQAADLDQGAGKATRRRGAALEAAILDAAWDLLKTDGWHGFTFGGVAERAQSSKPVLYRRWPNREELLRATLRRQGARIPLEGPDTGSLRGDVIAVLTRVNQRQSSVAAVMSMRLSASFQELGLSPAELRRELIGDRESAMVAIVARAVERGELGPKPLPARVVALPADLLRHELLMTLEAASPEVIASIVDDAFLPLARVSSGLADA